MKAEFSAKLKVLHVFQHCGVKLNYRSTTTYEGWNFNSGNYLFTTDTK